MPCGFKDPRRGGHRCVRCRQEHNKCDGKRPCSACRERGYKCFSAKDISSKLSFIAYHEKKAKASMLTPVGGLKSDDWTYSRLFFDSAQSSVSPVMQIFTFEHIGPLFHSSPLIQQIISLVGETYIARRKGLRSAPVRQRHLRLRSQALAQMSDKGTSSPSVVLLSACLLVFIELGQTYSTQGWSLLIRATREYVTLHQGSSSIQENMLGRMLYHFSRMSDAARCICFCEDIPTPDSWMMSLETGPGPLPAVLRGEEQLSRVANLLELWARLRYCAVVWIWHHERLPSKSRRTESSDSIKAENKKLSQHILHGIDLVCFASKLQRAIIGAILECPADNSPLPTGASTLQSSFLPYYHWALTGISQVFCHPFWESLGCSPPTMSHDMRHDQATRAIEWVQTRVNHLEAILVAPVLSISGAEMRTAEEREQVIDCVDTLNERGFNVFSRLSDELRGIWRDIEDMQ